MTSSERRQAADSLARVLERVQNGEVEAPDWYTERLIGALAAPLHTPAFVVEPPH
jgi:hypothetical protein